MGDTRSRLVGNTASHGEGSSRSSRDDSRPRRDSRERRDERRRSRSRSPRRRYLPPSKSHKQSPERYPSSKYGSGKSPSSDRRHKYSDRNPTYNEWSDEEDVPAPPPPPRITKISMGFSKPAAPIKMNLNTAPKPAPVLKPKLAVASVFNEDDDEEEPEEMPAEARMRMRNIGRDTPTSAGPNSFGKTKQGFCDAKKVFERNMKQALETTEKPLMGKFPQTIYKIKP